MGCLVQDHFPRWQNMSPDKSFHFIVALCYDKKLEALREDVSTASHSSQGADCVLPSGEIVQITEQSDLASNDAAETGDVKEEVRLHEGASSDGHLGHIFRHTAKELFNEDVGVLTCHTLRNKGCQEVTLKGTERACCAKPIHKVEDVPETAQEEFIELINSSAAKTDFSTMPITKFWIKCL
ncbi:nuclear prelamin A recognition factor-like [Pipistrellus kuhlii]|uniref:nuclear prelamin A recognition factor-like n=1 Tax=Pipistrellus kuhlii TaxID=59472 RepID=UPI001E2734C3|nr:nuclear prelamin A recognition factor-like [Pipistrellus kuhlii]